MSTQCIRCSHYLELGDKIVRGVQTGKLYAYDDVVFAEGCSFKGMEATGRRIEVRGKVFSKLRATAEIVAFAGAQLSGELHAPVVRVEPGAKVKVQTIECARLRVAGELEISGVLEATEILLAGGSTFSGRLNNPDAKLQVEAGARIDAESATCAEMIVEGELNLPGTVMAERVLVMAQGRMNVGPTQRRLGRGQPRRHPAGPDRKVYAPPEAGGHHARRRQGGGRSGTGSRSGLAECSGGL